MIRQEFGYGCGLLSVANALSMKRFVTEERMEASKDGNNLMQLNKWLLEDGEDIQIMPLYYKNGVQFRTPKIKMNFEGCPNIEYYPILVVIAIPRCPKNHMIAVHFNADNTVHVLDSCEKEPVFLFSWDEFRSKYPRIISLEVFKNFEDKEIHFEK